MMEALGTWHVGHQPVHGDWTAASCVAPGSEGLSAGVPRVSVRSE